MKRIVCFIGLICLVLTAFNTLSDESSQLPPNWPEPLYNITKNPFNTETILLGRVLFYDPILSRNNTISCASCHSPFTAFSHVDHALSHGIDNQIGTRNAPSLMNLAWQKSFMWDGSIEHLEKQSLAPISNPIEMNENIDHVVTKLKQTPMYTKLFFNAYGDSVITKEHILTAIAQFMLRLVSSNSRYDSMIRNQVAFTSKEQNGYILYKQHCSSCHTEPLFTNNSFENNGLVLDTTINDIGRMKVTKRREDSLKFKVPTLRNIEFTYPYMHDGRFGRISDVLKHYTTAVQSSPTLSEVLQKPIQLSSNEKVDLIAFLLTLTDQSFLFNPDFSYPKEILMPFTKDTK